MNLLICGGYGYIGSKILEIISNNMKYKDWNVTVIDNWSYGRGMTSVYEYFKKEIKNLDTFCFDISDSDEIITNKLNDIVIGTDYVINLCSLTQVPSTHLHEKYIIDGVKNLAHSILTHNNRIKKIIDISSTSIYGSVKIDNYNAKEPYSESIYPDPVNSLHNYASSKLYAEKVWQSSNFKSLPFTTLRLSTNIGYAIGLRYNQFINEFIINAIVGRQTIVPGAKTNVRPFIHVEDVANIILYLLDNSDILNGEVLNVGSEDLNPTLDELYNYIAQILYRKYKIKGKYEFAIEKDKNVLQESYLIDFTKFNNFIEYNVNYDFEKTTIDFMNKMGFK